MKEYRKKMEKKQTTEQNVKSSASSRRRFLVFCENACVMVFSGHVDLPPAKLGECREAEAKDGTALLCCCWIRNARMGMLVR